MYGQLDRRRTVLHAAARLAECSGIGPACPVWAVVGILPQAPVKNVVFYSVFMVSSTEGWAVGSGGVIYHYFGGAWSPVTSPVTSTLRSVFMLSPTEGWGVGDGGVIVHYSTGIWTGPVSPGTTASNLFSVFMVSSAEGWAFGNEWSYPSLYRWYLDCVAIKPRANIACRVTELQLRLLSTVQLMAGAWAPMASFCISTEPITEL